MNGQRTLRGALLAAAATAAMALAALPSFAGEADCRTVRTAFAKAVDTPLHMVKTQTSPVLKTPMRIERIYAGGAIYEPIPGGWQRSDTTLQEEKRHVEDAYRQAKVVACRYVRDEPVNGEAAAVYSEHVEMSGSTLDGSIWISKSRGLPLRQEVEVVSRGQKGHQSTTWDYDHVQVPPHAK